MKKKQWLEYLPNSCYFKYKTGIEFASNWYKIIWVLPSKLRSYIVSNIKNIIFKRQFDHNCDICHLVYVIVLKIIYLLSIWTIGTYFIPAFINGLDFALNYKFENNKHHVKLPHPPPYALRNMDIMFNIKCC